MYAIAMHAYFITFCASDVLMKLCFHLNRYPDEILSTKIIGERQFRTAVDLFESASEELTGKIDYRHVYLNFTNIEVELDSNKVVKTCPAALGPSFAAGTTDGPGAFGFQQGDTEVRALIVFLRNTNTIPDSIYRRKMQF